MRLLTSLTLLVLVAVTGLRSSYPIPPQINNLVTIGILSIPITSDDSPCVALTSTTTATSSGTTGSSQVVPSCFTTFYPKWVESAGARAVMIPYDADNSTLTQILDSVNGVLLTGGSLENLTFSSPYMMTAAAVFSIVKAKNDAGLFFPLHGTCQGFQVLSLLASQNQSVMVYNAFDAENCERNDNAKYRSIPCLHLRLCSHSSHPPTPPLPQIHYHLISPGMVITLHVFFRPIQLLKILSIHS